MGRLAPKMSFTLLTMLALVVWQLLRSPSLRAVGVVLRVGVLVLFCGQLLVLL